MARPKKQANAPDTRAEILRAARLEFAAQGFAAPLDAIARRCGIRRPSLLHYFPSKAALVIAVIDDILGLAQARLVKSIAAGGGDYFKTMQALVRELRDLETAEQGVGGALMHALLSEPDGGELGRKVVEFIDLIHSTVLMVGVSDAVPAAEVRAALTHLIMGEFTRMALGPRALELWGKGDGVEPLFRSYFIDGVAAKR